MLQLIRIPIALIVFVFISIIGAFLFLFRPFNPDNTRLAARTFSWFGTKILGIKVQLQGTEFFKDMPPSVVVANHQDNLDLIICGAVIPKRTVSVGKRSLLLLPGFGLIYWLAGNVLIDRSNKKNSNSTLDTTTEALTKGNRSIWMFAEGTRNQGKNILPFKKGAFRMAIEAGVPIVLICVQSYSGKLSLNKLNSGTVNIKVLEPISTKGLTLDDSKQLMDECWQKMKTTLDQLDKVV
ncbi:MAG: 1-acyl-sn-glycerol-3-phosphate acyltransferase [Oleiphilaceae bacterium]|jgi:1-acyl-sn-glycerol-3-phosphate acyltransferase